MVIRNDEDVIALIEDDVWMMKLLECAQSLQLPDWWICAGFVRSKIWDTLHGFTERTTLPDIDVIYFDPSHIDVEEEKRLEDALRKLFPTTPWSVKNQARMHTLSNSSPYSSSSDAISNFPETATSLGVSLDHRQKVVLVAPHGIQDVVDMIVRPTPRFIESPERLVVFENRLKNKNWKATWHKIEVLHMGN